MDEVDSKRWPLCPLLLEQLSLIMPEHRLEINADTFFLQVDLTGRQLQLLAAIVQAVWRCRCTLSKSLHFDGVQNMLQHMKKIIEDLWIQGMPNQQNRAERQAAVATIPQLIAGASIYY